MSAILWGYAAAKEKIDLSCQGAEITNSSWILQQIRFMMPCCVTNILPVISNTVGQNFAAATARVISTC